MELIDGETVRVPSRILTAVTTPNAILELDEINALEPAVAKFFNSLLDGDRAIFLNDQVIEAAPGVVFVGLVNPMTYDGVSDMADTLIDRANSMYMDYPPATEISASGYEQPTMDEAIILRKHIHPLAEISNEHFKTAWNSIINNSGERSSLDNEQIQIIKDLKNIIVLADRTRKLVHRSRTSPGSVSSPLAHEISLRGSADLVKLYSENQLWKTRNLEDMPNYETSWNAAQYVVFAEYLSKSYLYSRGPRDLTTIKKMLKDAVT